MTSRVHPELSELVRLRFKARGFSLLPKQPVSSLLSGRFASRLRGRGLVFEELRGYRPGDDIRTIDWKATARLRSTQIRVYTEERERPVLLVTDQRTSMYFGSQRTTKATTAVELGALAAWRTLDVGDRVGALVIGDQQLDEVRPQRSQRTVLRILHSFIEANQRLGCEGASRAATQSSNALNAALKRAVHIAKHDYLVVLITDFHGADEETRRLATRLASRNDVLACLVYDPLGISFPVSSPLRLTDGTNLRTILPDRNFEENFRRAFMERCTELRSILDAIRIPILPICTHEPVLDQVLYALGSSGPSSQRRKEQA